MGTTIPNRHIYLVGTGHNRSELTHPFAELTHPLFRNGLSPNRHIHSVRTGATILNRHVRSLNRNFYHQIIKEKQIIIKGETISSSGCNRTNTSQTHSTRRTG